MDVGIAALLMLAGLVGGVVNAIAGGATLITFPAMLAAGLPPVVANASNAIAVSPGHLMAAISDRGQLPPLDQELKVSLAAAFVGGGLGAGLLLVTPERLFTLMVPALIAVATLIFAFGRQIQTALPARTMDGAARAPALVPTAIYGGYFGAGLGVMLMAVITLTGREEVRAANALKNLLASAVNAASLVIFAMQGVVHWPSTLVMLVGALAGGVVGGRLAAVLPAPVVKTVVIVIGAAMTGIYAWRFWF